MSKKNGSEVGKAATLRQRSLVAACLAIGSRTGWRATRAAAAPVNPGQPSSTLKSSPLTRIFHCQTCSADFQVCCIADFQIGRASNLRDVCGFGNPRPSRFGNLRYEGFAR
jgi:hypothetical protein